MHGDLQGACVEAQEYNSSAAGRKVPRCSLECAEGFQTRFLFVIRTRSAATSHYSVASGAKRTTFCSMGVLRILAEGEITGCPLARQLSGVKLSRCPGLSLSGLAQSGHAIRAAECLLSRAGRNLTNFRVHAPANGRRTAPSHVPPRHLPRGLA